MREWLLLLSTPLLPQVSDEFLLFGFPDAHSSASFSVFLPGGLPSISVWIEGIEGEGEGREKRKKHISVCIYLKMDCQCLNHTWKKTGNQGKGRKTERKGHFGVTRGGVSCRKIALYCFCDRENVNWPCGFVTSHRERRGTKWTQNTPWEHFSIPDVAKTGIWTRPVLIVCRYA